MLRHLISIPCLSVTFTEDRPRDEGYYGETRDKGCAVGVTGRIVTGCSVEGRLGHSSSVVGTSRDFSPEKPM